MLSVTVIIAVLAGIVIGRLQNDRNGITFQRGIQSIESAANKARNQALRTGQTYELTFDSSSQSLKAAPYDDTSSETTTKKSTSSSSTGDTNSPDTDLGSGWSVYEIRAADGSTDETDLSIKFFADGTAESKSVELHNSNAPISLIVSQNGSIEVKRGALADAQPTEWEAGNIEQRATL